MLPSNDEARIFIKAGSGGNGSSSFLRSRLQPRGGPDGGNGGNGGNIIIKANRNINTLLFFKHKRIFQADNGKNGSRGKRNGKNGSNITIDVPVGTQIFDVNTKRLIKDLTQHEEFIVAAKGGKGGAGNIAYKTSVNQAPRKTGKGKTGEEALLFLSISMIGDAGMIGLPNAGKSSLLAKTTAAKVKVANYQFTTLTPQIGFVEVMNFDGFTMVDTPGIIEKASDGIGMGQKFLKHITRCKLLVHVIDASSENPIKDYHIIAKEIFLCNKKLLERIGIIVLNKSDYLEEKEKNTLLKKFKKETNVPIFFTSTETGEGIEDVMKYAFNLIIERRNNISN